MKKFTKHLFKIIGFSLLILLFSDAIYTAVFYHCVPRNKLQFVLKNENQNYNAVFIGSSRVANHIDTYYLDALTGEKNINLGVEGANYADNLLLLKLFVKNKNTAKKIFLQLDHFYEFNEMSAIANSDALPFIRNEIVQSHFKKYDKKYFSYYYFPFYRYLSADFKIGFREFFMSAINKKPKIDLNYGYIPKLEIGNLKTPEELPKTIAKSNIFVNEIIQLCSENNIELILFCAPFSSNIKEISYIDKLKMKYPNLYNYSKTMDDISFSNSTHLNNEGAKKFTHLIFQNHLKNE